MAIAGKVAITLSTENGGAWSADVTYDRLVAVKYNNNLYISRKTVSNVEPPNDEFWFLALEGFGGDDVQALIDRMNELSGLIQAIIDGTTQVGNAKTLDGHEADYFAPLANLANYTPNTTEELNTSILEKAVALLSNALRFYRLGGSSYTGGDLPSSNYAYGTAMVIKRYSEITVILFGISGTNQLAINRYASSSATWSGWFMDLTTAGGTVNGALIASATENNTSRVRAMNANRSIDLIAGSAYAGLYEPKSATWISYIDDGGNIIHNGTASGNLPITGGKVSAANIAPVAVENTHSEVSLLAYHGKSGLLGYLGFDGANNPAFMSGGTYKSLLHTGNYTDYAADVEDGTFTLKLGDVTLGTATYHKVGKIVYCYCTGSVPQEITAQYYSLNGFPFAITSQNASYFDFHTHEYHIKDGTGNLTFSIATDAVTIAATNGIPSGQAFVFTGIYMTNG